MSFSINIDFYDVLFADLKAYLLAKSVYIPTVLKKPMNSNPQYPQVVLTEIMNSHGTITIDRGQALSNLGYEIMIYTTDKVVSGKIVSNLVICRELAKLSDDVMFKYRFRRISQSPTPVVDTTLYNITSRYNGTMFNNYAQIL